MGSEQQIENRLHIFFLPLMASGHIIPTLDIAKLFAQRGVRCSVVTTAAYAAVARSAIKNTPAVDLHLVELPSSNYSKSLDMLCSLHLIRPAIEAILRDLNPTAVVADMFFPWTTALCAELGLPRLLFSGTSIFTRCAKAAMHKQKLYEIPFTQDESTGDDAVVLEGLPHRIQFLKTQLPGPQSISPQLAVMLNEMEESAEGCYGELFNSFYELEPDYAQHFKEVLGRRAWFVGPVSLRNHDTKDLSVRGADSTSPISRRCQEWLDSKPSRSVLYICFGSLKPLNTVQHREISLALESGTFPFLWVVRDDSSEETSSPWLTDAILHKEGAGECLIVRGWAPQLLILNHGSVGGFMTHCGWNSSLEGVSVGVPMVTWPLFADQFYNERLIVDVLKVGVEVGSEYYTFDDDTRPVIAAAAIETAMRQLMGDGAEAEARRQRASKLAAAAKTAVLDGGSSFTDIDILIKELGTTTMQ